MSEYKIDRSLLEAYSTEEILRILREERADYVPEAIAILEEILDKRGITRTRPASSPESAALNRAEGPEYDGGEMLVQSPADATRILNDVLAGVLNGSVEPQVGQAAASIVMSILRAMELEYMCESAGCCDHGGGEPRVIG